MTGAMLPDAKALTARVRQLDCVVSLPAVSLIVIYLWSQLELQGGEAGAIGVALLAYVVLSAVVVEFVRRRQLAPLSAYLENRRSAAASGDDAAGSDATEEDAGIIARAFASAIVLPSQRALSNAVIWFSLGMSLPLLMAVQGHGVWLESSYWGVMFVASATGAIVTAGFVFFLFKQYLEPIRYELAADLPNPDRRAELVTALPLGTKVQAVMLGCVVTTLLLTISLSFARTGMIVDGQVADWQERVLDRVAGLMSVDSFEGALGVALPNDAVTSAPMTVSRIESTTSRLKTSGGLEAMLANRVRTAVAEGERVGRSPNMFPAAVISWRALPAGDILVARVSKADLRTGFSAYASLLAALAALSCSMAGGLAWLLARDIRRAVETLEQEALRMARGDLRRGRIWEAEDEMGVLGRAFERMSTDLSRTVGGVAEAADRVDQAVADISAVSRSVAVASADQVRRIQQAGDLMLEINQQVRGVSESAQALNLSVEESSSSILELGAAGDELNDTATVLSGKVDEVSGSIEQMVRTSKEVGNTSERLSDAAAETASSMEEMASAMRAVDNTAAATASLSNDVVGLAEGGQTRVSQTIDGMAAIRDATDAAERVIRGLGGRAKEIGGILDVIDDVADETNLLALNAAIISAQAGEHGRAFSVVADEIKELADRVLASTKEIGGLIRSVQDESEAAVGAIEAGSTSVAGGVELSAEAGTSLEEINRAARESGTRIGEIVRAVREQTHATTHVVGLMEAVRDGVDHISRARTEQDGANEVVYRSAVTMQEVAQQVRRTTEEQSRGFGRIRESIEDVRSAVENINGSLRDQSSACSQVAEFLEQVADGTRSNEEAAGRMNESMQLMMSQAQALREDVSKFEI